MPHQNSRWFRPEELLKSKARRVDLCRILLEGAADLNLQTDDGHSALLLGIAQADVPVDVVELLIAFKADQNAPLTKDRKTPLHIAVTNINPKYLKPQEPRFFKPSMGNLGKV